MNIIINIIILFCLVSTVKSGASFILEELLYNNNTNDFYGYPVSTSATQCQFSIPFSVTSYEDAIKNVEIASEAGLFKNTFISDDGLVYIGTLLATITDSSKLIQFNIVRGVTSGISKVLHCLPFDSSSIEFKVLNVSIYYNNLGLLIESSNLPYENVTLDFDIPVPVKQSYLGYGKYFISLLYNTDVLFSSNKNKQISIPIKFNSLSKTLTFTTPFQSSNNLIPTESFITYPTNNNKQSLYSAFLKMNGLKDINNYYFAKNSLNVPVDEPFLVSSSGSNIFNYLVPFYSGIETSFAITHYYQNNKQLFYSKTFNQSLVSLGNTSLNQTLVLPDSIETEFLIPEAIYPIVVEVGEYSNKLSFRYPYGCISGNSKKSVYSFSYEIISTRKQGGNIMTRVNGYHFNISVTISDTSDPKVNDPIMVEYSIDLMPNNKLLMFLNFSTDNIDSIAVYDSPLTIYKTFQYTEIKIRSRSSSSSLGSQIVLPRFDIYKLQVITKDQVFIDYILDPFYLYKIVDDLSSLKSVKDLDKLPKDSTFDYSTGLKSVSFLFNDLIVTNKGISNKMFIKLSNYPTDREVQVTFIYSDYRANEKKDVVYSTYSSATNQFEFEFNIPKNIKTGNVSYMITLDSLDNINYFSYSLPTEYQLRISESDNIDLFGPAVTNLKITVSYNPNVVSYNLEISDSANGFKQGHIIVRGSLDMTERNITILPANLYGGTLLKGAYSVSFNYDSKCNAQVYQIVYAYFEDTEGYFTEYDILNPSKKNPFYLILDTFNPSIIANCDQSFPTADGYKYSPDIVYLSVPPPNTLLKSKEVSRIVIFNYTSQHQDGISSTYLPTLYLSIKNLQVFKSFSTVILYSNSTFTQFSSKILLPYLEIRGEYRISIYGLVSRSGTSGGFTPRMLSSKGLPNSFNYSMSIDSPIITSSSKLSSTGLGGLWLYGLYFNIDIYGIKIQYTEFNETETVIPKVLFPTTIYFETIKATTKPINILFSNSDPFTVYPTIYNFNPSSSSSSSSSSNNDTSLCKGSPSLLCGGPSQGICLSNGCKCKSPWIGDDCMSKIIQVPPPTINETNPSTNITTGGDNNSTINSIISIVGIKEISIDSKEENRYYFEEWTYKLLFSDDYVTRYTYSSYIKKEGIKVSDIIVTLDWYKVESTIQFANEELHINPSTIKYTIKITSYPFTTQLNTLQLIMKATIQSNNTNSCSDKQFGQTIQNDADYVKLQINNYSFYGRFIKRCQIDDNQITKLTNTLLDSTMNDTISNNNHQTSHSYIGINIPIFQDNVILDPDFSILLENSDNSAKCKDGNSGLTKSQLAGVIVASVAFFIVLVIIIAVIIYKSPGCLSTKIFFYKLIKNKK